MKTIKEYVKKNHKVILVALFAGALLILIGYFDATDRQNERVLVESEWQQWKLRYTDSLQTVVYRERIEAIDSIKRQYEARTKASEQKQKELQKQITQLNKKLEKEQSTAHNAVENYLQDSIQTEKCDSAIFALQQVNETLIEKTDVLEKQVVTVLTVADGYRNQLVLTEKELALSDSLISQKDAIIVQQNSITDNLQKQLKKDNNWWNKNRFQIGFVSGVIVAGAVVYGLTR